MSCYAVRCPGPSEGGPHRSAPLGKGENTVRRILIGLMALAVLGTTVLGGMACKKGGAATDQETKTLQTSPPGGKGPGPVTPTR